VIGDFVPFCDCDLCLFTQFEFFFSQNNFTPKISPNPCYSILQRFLGLICIQLNFKSSLHLGLNFKVVRNKPAPIFHIPGGGMPPPSVSIATICLGFKNALAEGIKCGRFNCRYNEVMLILSVYTDENIWIFDKYGRFNCRYNKVMLICLSIPMKIYGFLIDTIMKIIILYLNRINQR